MRAVTDLLIEENTRILSARRTEEHRRYKSELNQRERLRERRVTVRQRRARYVPADHLSRAQ